MPCVELRIISGTRHTSEPLTYTLTKDEPALASTLTGYGTMEGTNATLTINDNIINNSGSLNISGSVFANNTVGRNGVALSAGFRWAIGKDGNEARQSLKDNKTLLPEGEGVRSADEEAVLSYNQPSPENLNSHSSLKNSTLSHQRVEGSSASAPVKAQKPQKTRISHQNTSKFANLKTKIDIFFAKMNGEPLPQSTLTQKAAYVQKL